MYGGMLLTHLCWSGVGSHGGHVHGAGGLSWGELAMWGGLALAGVQTALSAACLLLPGAVRALRLMTAAIFALGEKVAPDPTDTFTERRTARKAAERAALKASAAMVAEDPDEEALQFAERMSAAQGGARCPYPHEGAGRQAVAEPLATS
jgi:hypothetical protein